PSPRSTCSSNIKTFASSSTRRMRAMPCRCLCGRDAPRANCVQVCPRRRGGACNSLQRIVTAVHRPDGMRCAFAAEAGYSRRSQRNRGGDMALLIVNLDKMIGNAEAWRAAFAAQLPGVEIRIWPEAGDPKEIEY